MIDIVEERNPRWQIGRAPGQSLSRVPDVSSVADGKARPHEHAGVETIYVLSGQLGVTVEETECTLKTGDLLGPLKRPRLDRA
jgi:mannose-6-phosphate isomerase-like protein (cupin superfamily)